MKRLASLAVLVALAMMVTAPAGAQRQAFPDRIELPTGFFPEGIAVGTGDDVYTGSLVDGAIWKGSLRSGEGEILVPGVPGTVAVGMSFDDRSGSLFVAGGFGGTAIVYDGTTGATVAQVNLGPGFINDVIITRTAAYFTNSFAPELYELPLDARGRIAGLVRTIPLLGDFESVPGFNANGIEATPNGTTLIVANSAAGELYTVDPETGVASSIDLGGVDVSGDGLVLAGKTLYANENSLNRIAKIQLSPDLGSGTVRSYLTSPEFDIPTTSARFGSSLYAVNAKFGTPSTGTPYEIVRVDR